MIILSLGNVGSGKTASTVREMYLNNIETYYSNIITSKMKNNITITSEMIVKKEVKGYKKKRNGDNEPVIEKSVNKEFWKNIQQSGNSINVVLDEAHTVLNSRRSMSKQNILVTDWLALIRRVLGNNSYGMGDLILITQLHSRVDTIARGMIHQIRYHICHYMKKCNCGFCTFENSEHPEPLKLCPNCTKPVVKCNHQIEVFKFKNLQNYLYWFESNKTTKTYFDRFIISDIENYFGFYDTFQWDNLLSDY